MCIKQRLSFAGKDTTFLEKPEIIMLQIFVPMLRKF